MLQNLPSGSANLLLTPIQLLDNLFSNSLVTTMIYLPMHQYSRKLQVWDQTINIRLQLLEVPMKSQSQSKKLTMF